MNKHNCYTPLKLAAITLSLSLLAGCSSSDDDDGDNTGNGTDTFGATSPTRARIAINNGYYLRTIETYGPDDALWESTRYDIDYQVNTLTAVDTTGQDQDNGTISAIYQYNIDGDMAGLDTYLLFPEISSTSAITRLEGVLQEVNQEQLIGSESDLRVLHSYDDAGRLTVIETDYLDFDETDTFNYYYDDQGLLASMTETDYEMPGVLITNTFSHDSEGRLVSKLTTYEPNDQGMPPEAAVDYGYDDNGNVTTIDFFDAAGALLYRDVNTYAESTEPVFNLTLFGLFYH